MVCSITILQAQERVVTGTVTDANDGMGIPGVSVVVKGTTVGTSTNIDGKFTISADATSTLVFSFIGYVGQELLIGDQTQLNIVLSPDVEKLSEVVVIGYGSVKKEDATGSVTAIDSDDFNMGAITSPEKLISGKIAGVQITSAGGAPGSKSQIRIRGGASLSASNDPLIVIDGIPVENEDIAGMRNILNMVNSDDIETFTVLKDASSTAIYGSRASNGVILITTKEGKKGGALKLNYHTKLSVSKLSKTLDVYDADEYRTLVKQRYGENSDQAALLGNANTDWQDAIFQTSVSQNHVFTATGAIQEKLPFHASIGYDENNGVLKTSKLDRKTASLRLTPTFFDDHLRVDASFKGAIINNDFADEGAIGAAVAYDPTQPKYNQTGLYGGYHTWLNNENTPNTIATDNPLAMLALHSNKSEVSKILGNLQLDYKFHFLPELKVNLKLGYDHSNSDGDEFIPAFSALRYSTGGEVYEYTQERKNKLLDFYFNYKKDIESIDSKIDATVGYGWQHFWKTDENERNNVAGTLTPEITNNPMEYYLVSFFGRLNYTFKDKYLLTFSLREDGTSRFDEDNRWGVFPAAAFAWKINQENFLKDFEVVSNLKLRLGYGITGQQALMDDNYYPHLPVYEGSTETAKYQLGNAFVTTQRPSAYDKNLKWEETTTYNVGLDFGFLANRISGSFDVYKRETKDLINNISIPAGTNNSNIILTNVGNLENKGFEFSLSSVLINTDDFRWDFNYNFTYNKNEITKLTLVDDPDYEGVPVTDISGGVGSLIQIHTVGHAKNSFYVYEQAYDITGKPLEGVFVDRNEDGTINENDMYRYKTPDADVFMGLSTSFAYKNWDLSLSGRINLNNYVYDNIASTATYNQIALTGNYLINIPKRAEDAGFEIQTNKQLLSDYYVQNASFFKLDNITLGYNLNKVSFLSKDLNIRLYATAQNVFTITKYDGLDPEIDNGVDDNIYPRPKTFLLGLNVKF